jgi:hypothetical protein
MKRHVYAVAVLAMLVPSVAGAACSQADMTGKSKAYALASSPTLGAATLSCNITLSNVGKVTGGNCLSSAGINSSLSSGTIKLVDATKCIFRGSFASASVNATIDSATLSPNKQVLTGVGTIGSDGVFLMTLIRL